MKICVSRVCAESRLDLARSPCVARPSPRQVPEETEALAIEAARHECEQDRRRARRSGTTRTPRACASATRRAPGSATAGTPASESRPRSRPASTGSSSAATAAAGVCSFSSAIAISRIGRGCPQAASHARAALRVLHHEAIERADSLEHGAGNDRLGWRRPSDKAPATRYRRAAHGTSKPSARSIDESAMSGRPTSAVGSSPPRRDEQRDAQALALGAAGAVERGLAARDSARFPRPTRRRKRHVGGDERARGAARCAALPAAKRRVEKRPMRPESSRSWRRAFSRLPGLPIGRPSQPRRPGRNR